MNPDQLAKSGTEHAHQVALFAYVAVACRHGFDTANAWASDGEILEDAIEEFGSVEVPALRWFHAIHNQGHGDKIRGANAKAEGVRAGIADCFLPWPVLRGHKEQDLWFIHRQGSPFWHGLYIEMKKPNVEPKKQTSKGGLSEAQIQFKEYALNTGYGWVVCYNWRSAADMLRSYIEFKG